MMGFNGLVGFKDKVLKNRLDSLLRGNDKEKSGIDKSEVGKDNRKSMTTDSVESFQLSPTIKLSHNYEAERTTHITKPTITVCSPFCSKVSNINNTGISRNDSTLYNDSTLASKRFSPFHLYTFSPYPNTPTLPHFITLLLLLSVLLIGAVENPIKTGFARLQYDGGGDWYNDPEVLPNLAKFANSVMNASFPIDQAVVKASDPKLFDYPFLYLTGHGNIRFTDREVENLRLWMLRGGFLYADDDYGMDASFRREIKRIFPEKELSELDASFPLFTSFYDFSSGLPKIHKHDEKPPQAFGIFDDNGRLVCLYTYETNISDGWADPETHNNPPEVRTTALKFGVNILQYVLNKP